MKVSIIIPCYNHGLYLEETINSIEKQAYKNFEVIIINDGSTDQKTLDILYAITKAKKYTVISIDNSGPAVARTVGIEKSSGEFILLLDSDDLIHKKYLEKCVAVFESDLSIGIVYSEAKYFGAKRGKWKIPDYSIEEMLLTNCIYISAMFRRSEYQKTSGFDSKFRRGYEDWDFFLNFVENSVKVHRIKEILFYYRKHKEKQSRQDKIDIALDKYLRNEIVLKHQELYIKNMIVLLDNNCNKISLKKLFIFVLKKTLLRIMVF